MSAWSPLVAREIIALRHSPCTHTQKYPCAVCLCTLKCAVCARAVPHARVFARSVCKRLQRVLLTNGVYLPGNLHSFALVIVNAAPRCRGPTINDVCVCGCMVDNPIKCRHKRSDAHVHKTNDGQTNTTMCGNANMIVCYVVLCAFDVRPGGEGCA